MRCTKPWSICAICQPTQLTKGPHDITPLLPKYLSVGLHPAIICLYSILPYINENGTRRNDICFIGGSLPLDFRDEDVLESSRWPQT